MSFQYYYLSNQLDYNMQMNVPNPAQNPKEGAPKPQVLQYKKIYELIDSNREVIKKLPELLLMHLQLYQKAHFDESAEISKSIDDGNFLEQLNNFKSVSFEFVQNLTLIKKNFTTLLTREQEPCSTFDQKRASNFQVFTAQHCEVVVNKYVDEIGTIEVQGNVPKIQGLI